MARGWFSSIVVLAGGLGCLAGLGCVGCASDDGIGEGGSGGTGGEGGQSNIGASGAGGLADGCLVQGQRYAEGDGVPSGDCNTCSCTGQRVMCTLIECNAACQQDADCDASEFCLREVGACDAEGYCAQRLDDSECPDLWAPVCTCSGIEFANDCEARAEGQNLASNQACVHPIERFCSVRGVEVPHGATVDAGDGCNTCTCIDGELQSCTESGCQQAVSCGGERPDTTSGACTENQYCAYEAEDGYQCGAADAPSICLFRPSSCSGTGPEVCGCDGNTYPTACAAAMAGQGVYSEGPCG